MGENSKKHHFVPRSILRNFENDKGKLFVFDKRATKSFPSNPDDTGHENNFNSVKIDGDLKNFENSFQENDNIVGLLSKKLRELTDKFDLTQKEKYDLAYITRVQQIRTKLIRTDSIGISEDITQWLRNRDERSSDLDTPKPPLIENDEKAKLVTLELLRSAVDFIPYFLQRGMVLFRTEEKHPFWCSDNPVIMYNESEEKLRGFLVQGTHIYFPISKTLLVAFICKDFCGKLKQAYNICIETNKQMSPDLEEYHNGLFNNEIINIEHSEVDFYNSLQVLNSSRFLYSNLDEFELAKKMISEAPELKTVTIKSKIYKG
jgi:Protein of unknown function (DUF4238)